MFLYILAGTLLFVGFFAYSLFSGKVGVPTMVAGVIVLLLKVTGAVAAEKVPLPKPSPIVNAAKAKRQAVTIWPALSQREVNDVTARAKQLAGGTAATGEAKPKLNIFCYDETKCGDLASSLENAFESARWTVNVRYTASMIPPGLQASPKVIKTLATIDPHFGLGEDPEPEAIESITIGERPDPKGWKE
jgi:hypothetical protein